jgi:hypothetical protein
MGLGCFFVGMPGGDYAVWGILWTGALVYAASKSPATTIAQSADWIRTAHGLSAGIIIAGFVISHLANHVVALWSLDHNKSIMDVLRLAKLPSASDLQTATAAYLAVYVLSHLIAVLVLGRWLLAVDTNFAWASGAPTGLLLDPWNVRLVPHYFLAVLFLIGHLAVGLRAVLSVTASGRSRRRAGHLYGRSRLVARRHGCTAAHRHLTFSRSRSAF